MIFNYMDRIKSNFVFSDGEIRLFRKEGLAAFKLLGEANDARPLPISGFILF